MYPFMLISRSTSLQLLARTFQEKQQGRRMRMSTGNIFSRVWNSVVFGFGAALGATAASAMLGACCGG
ncbi:Schizosaccharomyces specific microprotein Smp3 [Schizosaccharomyces osmophilus]|uniref:Schizosaccharomyces specific microprotein Smp3 n=1 Tax=Schizosaccharomyces osmophilus TaxID=2545709 RepID=A0AAE9WBG4_9SCHI|nr:Schizosaccharomyces specific microprotein Smp3 [Schizosaccharomyces osmophilus]WBW72564.1 Schizosaccharomyces specific microprotein Smp3 [Schizosaccharomyces osmophilus]